MFAAFVLAGLVFDDGALTSSGAPKLLSAHATVRMVREEVDITIGEKTAKVRCKFWFKNAGPGTTVRIGFPEKADGAYDTQHGEDLEDAERTGKPARLYNQLTGFRSWVDGKEAKTKLIASKDGDPYASYHVKEVPFKKGQSRLVVDEYTQPVGGGITNTQQSGNRGLHEFGYVLKSGASWHGPIGDVWVTARFNRKNMGKHLVAASELTIGKESAFEYDHWDKIPTNHVYYLAPVKPQVTGNALIFHKKNWKPNMDLHVAFDFSAAPF